MIVRDIMVTRLVTVEPEDTLAHAANLLRQYQFHHLPVTRKIYQKSEAGVRTTLLTCEGMLSSQDINLAVALARQSEQEAGRQLTTSVQPNGKTDGASEEETQLWQERRVVEVMHRASMRVTSTASVAAAAQILVDRGLNCLPVVEYRLIEGENRVMLVGLITRSDLLLTLSRAMGAFEPGMQLEVHLPPGDSRPLARTLELAAEQGVRIRSVMAAPRADGTLHVATLRLGTINPTPLLTRLREEGITYAFGVPPVEGREKH